MKSKKKQRILALILSMVLMLSASISALAEGDVQTEASGTETTENQAAVQSLEQETVPETEVTTEEGGIDTQSAETSTEPVQENTEQEVTETPAEPEQGVTEETAETTDTTQSQAQSTEVQEESDAAEEIPVEEQPGETTEETATEETVVSEAAELKQEFTDENGNVTQTVTAYVPEGAFQATADQISMEVSLLNTDDTNYIKGMMEELLPENHYLDGYVLYQIDFKVNGEITKPAKAITITMAGNELAVEDTQKAHVFYYDSEDPEVEGDEDQLVEVIQKDQLLKSLEETGQSTENIEDYDYSEITVNEGNADTITVKGWESTIYGCYVEKESVQEVTYEDDTVKVTVSADEKGIIPNKTTLQVVPISNNGDTKDQYKEVEKKLQEKAEKDEYEIAGFLAYDISFVDKDGNEVEPNGEVRVSIEYKEATLPEGMTEEEAKEAEVSMLHLEENENGEVKEVVDMAEKEQVEAIATTENQQVEKIAVKTESFSTFTVIWQNRWYSNSITVHHVDINGNEIQGNRTEDLRLDYGDNAVLGNYAGADGYIYQSAHINSYRGTEVYSVKYSSRSGWTYKTRVGGGDREWEGNGDKHVYLVYEKQDELATVQTVDNATGGITMKMTNYDTPANNINIGGGYGQGNVKQGLLKNKLENGYPITTGRSNGTANRDLSSLFENGQDVNNLFLQSTYDETGYYEYSSFDNYAYLNQNGNFTVYEQIGTPSDHKNDNAYYYNRGNFLPYNKLDTSVESGNHNLYDNEGESLNRNDPRYGEELYTSREGTDYYFGMYMEVAFSQPEDGLAIHNDTAAPMVYEFNGDDDLWVYIDDVLVLDIGGIHDAHSGYINFQTGEVHVECVDTRGNNQDTTIKEMFRTAGVFPDGSDWDEDKVNIYFDGDTFRDYSTHNLKMFYMERGAGASNLHMKFNLQTVPEGTIEIAKNLTNTDKEKYANIEFAFQVWAQKVIGTDDQGNEIYSETEYVLLNENSEDITATKGDGGEPLTFQNGVQIGEETYDSVFYLKPDESARFSGLQKDRKYYVKEIGVNPGEYDEVIINGTEIISTSNDGEISKITDITSSEEEVGRRPSITFQNSCTAANSRELQITKQMKQGQTTEDTFTFNVWLEGTDGSQSPYNGGYYLTREINGEIVYYHYVDNVLTPYEGNEESLICDTATNGVISRVPAGYTVSITGILSGTSFLVTEADPGEGYLPPEKTLVEETYTTEGKESWADGEILLGEDAEVIITNSMKQQLQVTKQWVGADNDPSDTTIYVGLYNGNGATGQYVTLTTGNDWTATFQSVDSSYYVKDVPYLFVKSSVALNLS